MIRRGREQGWLRQPIDKLPTWAGFNGVTFKHIKIGPIPGLEHRGSTVIATKDLLGEKEEPLMMVPKELIVSRPNIELFAKSDQHLKEVLDATGDFGRVRLCTLCYAYIADSILQTTRGAVLIFLLMQATKACPDINNIGVHNPLNE